MYLLNIHVVDDFMHTIHAQGLLQCCMLWGMLVDKFMRGFSGDSLYRMSALGADGRAWAFLLSLRGNLFPLFWFTRPV